ncbi:hypothetical protein HZH68_005678 [Vespula germanica]|uniref:Uncharacterized protein n=1 Tax=Vespula germanica TaxID=30212 RepID=A0A834NFQ9_VESGE|nr:hypothetical protein HZH68_005678 [Vespula germanica]
MEAVKGPKEESSRRKRSDEREEKRRKGLRRGEDEKRRGREERRGEETSWISGWLVGWKGRRTDGRSRPERSFSFLAVTLAHYRVEKRAKEPAKELAARSSVARWVVGLA